MMQSPGKTDIHHLPAMSGPRPSDIIKPQAGFGGGTPTPRKLSEASMMIATPMVKLKSTITVFMTLGKMWSWMMRRVLAPVTCASCTNGLLPQAEYLSADDAGILTPEHQ